MKKIALKNAARGTAFDYAGQSWILLENDPTGRTLCLSKDITETRAFDEGNCNNFAVASSNKYLNGPYLDNLADACNGANAFLESELDLTTDDGLKDYGTCTVTIFLLTVDQYRRNRDVIPNADDWWWLSTAFSTKSNGYESLARRVLTDGTLGWSYAYLGHYGLRPACYLDSDLLISIEDDEATDDVTPEHAGEIIAALAEQFGGTFATEDQLTTALSFMLGTLRATREKEARHELRLRSGVCCGRRRPGRVRVVDVAGRAVRPLLSGRPALRPGQSSAHRRQPLRHHTRQPRPDPEGQDHDQPDGIRRGGQQQEGRRRRLEQELVRGRRLVLWRRRPASERRHRRSIQQRQGCEETQQRTAQVKRGDPMKASGNGAPEICVQNLLKTIRGEVPYERIKGIDRTLIDKPSETAATDLAADVEFLVETYEPRVQLSDSDLKALTAQAGDFELRASIDNIT